MSRIRIKDLEHSLLQSIIATDTDGEAFYLSGNVGENSMLVYRLNHPEFVNMDDFAANGIIFNDSLSRLELGGILNRHTIIDLDSYNFTLNNGNDITFESNKLILNLANQLTLDTLTTVINSTISISLNSPIYYLYPFTNLTSDTGFSGKVFFTDSNSKLKYGTITTQNIQESVNLYFTDTRARNAISEGIGIDYDSLTGIVSIDTTYLGTNYIINQNSVIQTGTFNINGDVKAGSFKSTSINGSFVPNKLTTIERDLITPESGSIIFNTIDNCLQTYISGTWENLSTVSGTYTDEDSLVIGNRDGLNVNYYLTYNYITNSAKVYLNGVRLQKTIDYTEGGTNLIIMNYPPIATDVIVVDYIKE